MTTFCELVRQFDWTALEPRFKELYPDATVEGHARAYECIRFKEPGLKPDYMIHVHSARDAYDEEDETIYHHVSGYTPTDEHKFSAIEFEPWGNWLAAEIDPDCLLTHTPLDIVCHCLHEMTFCGYDEEDGPSRIKEVKKTMDDYFAEQGTEPPA